jgi:hypothetical protein
MNTFLNYIPGIIPVVTAVIAITLHIKTSKHNFAFENRKMGINPNSKWSLQWFDFAIIGLHLAFITFMNMYFLAGQHDDIIMPAIINGFTLLIIYLQTIVFEIDTNNSVVTRMKSIKV